MRILHIASFMGNIGDNFNHYGSRKLLEEKLGSIEWEEIEIRETFRGSYAFDLGFAEYCNRFDAVIFGGGNFFELWVDHSVNNTSANIPLEVLDQINVPFYFYALGVDPGMGVSSEGVTKFKNWVDHLSEKDNFHLSTRNDGAQKTLKNYFLEGFDQHFSHLVDGGFLADTGAITNNVEDAEFEYIGINVAGDMLDIRFDGEVSYEEFVKELASHLNDILEEHLQYKVLLIPHIFRDYKVVFDILDAVNDTFRRERLDVAALSQGDSGMIEVIKAYHKCSIVLANRFHSNVIGLMLKKNVLGLNNYRQIKDLYEEIDLDNYFNITTKEGLSELFTALKSAVHNKAQDFNLLDEEYLMNERLKTEKFFEALWTEN